MNMKKTALGLMILLLFFCSLPCHAQTKSGYVSDTLLLTLREGPGNSFSIIKTLKSNTPLIILEEQAGYYKVQLEDDATGWVEKQYIMFDVPKSMKIDQLVNKIKTLEVSLSKVQMLNSSLKELVNSQKAEYVKKLETLEASLKSEMDEKTRIAGLLSESQKKFNSLVAQSGNIQETIKTNKSLVENNKTLEQKLSALEKKNSTLFKTGMIYWFLAGAGVLLFGWIIGHNVSLRRRRSSSLLD